FAINHATIYLFQSNKAMAKDLPNSTIRAWFFSANFFNESLCKPYFPTSFWSTLRIFLCLE
ncbi:MAG: hypothetical protein WCD18_19590, partial [Thermosynechococcaceae cyanobacterium]